VESALQEAIKKGKEEIVKLVICNMTFNVKAKKEI
jgi:hypothetical protein